MSFLANKRMWRQAEVARRLAVLLLVLLMAYAAPAANTNLDYDLGDLKIKLWNEVTDLRGSAGYKDNPSLANTNRQGAGFWDSGADLLVYRLPTSGWLFNFIASADDVRYFGSPAVKDEQTILAAAQLTRAIGSIWSSGIGANYLYQNQVFDLTVIETNLFPRTQVVGQTFGGRWFVRRETARNWFEAEVGGFRQLLSSPLDSFWQAGTKLSLGHRYDSRSDVSLNLEWKYLWFDTRQQADRQQQNIPGTHLRFTSPGLELGWHRIWDEQKHWHTTATVGLQQNQDNGSHVFDFWQAGTGLKLEYRADKWSVSGRARFDYNYFTVETTTPDGSSLRNRMLVTVNLRAERKLTKSIKLFATYVCELSLGNVDTDRYEADTTSLGIDWQF